MVFKASVTNTEGRRKNIGIHIEKILISITAVIQHTVLSSLDTGHKIILEEQVKKAWSFIYIMLGIQKAPPISWSLMISGIVKWFPIKLGVLLAKYLTI